MQREIETLIQGYEKFRSQNYHHENSAFIDLVRLGQRPKILIIACSDSRVDPAIVMDCQPGDLFVIRNVANLVPPYEDDQSYHGTSAALEFGVTGLGIHHIILFGHTQCGGIQSLLEHPPQKNGKKSFINKWMELAAPAHEAVLNHHANLSLEEKTTLCGKYSLINSLKNLQTFPCIAEGVEKKTLFLHAWNFDLSQGILEEYDPVGNCFRNLRDKK